MPNIVSLTFPDGSVRELRRGDDRRCPCRIDLQIARQEGGGLCARRHAARPCPTRCGKSGKVEIVTREDPRALELIRHDAAHVLAEAVQELWPGTQVTIGPVIENGFYYDFARNEPFTPEDFPAIEKKMREIIGRNKPFTKEVWSRDKARKVFRDKGESLQARTDRRDPRRPGPQDLRAGRLVRPLPRPAHGLDRPDRQRLQADEGGRRLLARRFEQSDADAHLRHCLGRPGQLDAYLDMLEEAEKRDHRRLGREMDLFHFQEEGPGVVFWHAKGWKMFQSLVAYMRRRLDEQDYQEVNAPQVLDKSLWETSGHWGWYQREHVRGEVRHASPARRPGRRPRIFALKPMNCPGHVQIFKHGLKSYRELPIRLAEFGTVHRYEPSGALHGLMRVRGFTQDDAHIFCTEEQLAAEMPEDQRPDPVGLQRFRLRGGRGEARRRGRRSASARMRCGIMPRTS